jgi:hypothetical protein
MAGNVIGISDGGMITSGLSTYSRRAKVRTVGEFWGVLRRTYDEIGVIDGLSLLGK